VIFHIGLLIAIIFKMREEVVVNLTRGRRNLRYTVYQYKYCIDHLGVFDRREKQDVCTLRTKDKIVSKKR
jgi:hypothetical protein